MVKILDLYSQEVARTEDGELCLYERGGSYNNTGLVRLIGDGEGNAKRAICVRVGGDLSCGDHAAIPIEVGDHIIEVTRHYNNVTVSIGVISDIDVLTVTILGAGDHANRYEALDNMIGSGIAKSYDYHCSRPYYVKDNIPV